MKIHNKIFFGAVVIASLSACSNKLDVSNPNYFTDEQITKEIMNGNDESKKRMVMEGMVNTMKDQILRSNANYAGGYSNGESYEYAQEYMRAVQVSDIVEGDEVHHGSFYRFYTNDPTLRWTTTDAIVYNNGYYRGPVDRIAASLHPLWYINQTDKSVLENDKLLRGYRAQCNTIRALGYIQLMERWTDLQDVTSTTKQGWPIYGEGDYVWGYSDPLPPSSVAETWAWIKSTLQQAVADFKFSGIGDGGYTVTTQAGNNNIQDIDLGVAQYELARAGLDSKDYQVVITACQDILEHYPNFIKPEDYGMNASKLAEVNAVTERPDGKKHFSGTPFNASENAFFNLEKNPEAIWGRTRESNASSQYYGYFNPLITTEGGFCQVDKNIYDKLSDNDCRKACILPEDYTNFQHYSVPTKGDTVFTTHTMPKYTSLKFAATVGIDANSENGNWSYSNTQSDLIYMRASTVRLMLAEAYAQTGQDALAKEQLNLLLQARTIPGRPTMTCDNTMAGMSTMDMVKLQWRIETWGEADWAFFNCKRWNEVPARGDNQWSKNAVSIKDMTWEIPSLETQGNPYWN